MNMSNKAFTALLAVVLACIGFAASVTGIFRDEKSFYAISAACMLLASILLFYVSRSNVRAEK